MENNQNRNYDKESHNPENEPWTPDDQKVDLDRDLTQNFDEKNQDPGSGKKPLPFPDEIEDPNAPPSDSNPQNDDENDENDDNDNDDDDLENDDIEGDDDDFLEKDIDYREKIERDSLDRNPNI
jgi:hypothetical protein